MKTSQEEMKTKMAEMETMMKTSQEEMKTKMTEMEAMMEKLQDETKTDIVDCTTFRDYANPQNNVLWNVLYTPQHKQLCRLLEKSEGASQADWDWDQGEY